MAINSIRAARYAKYSRVNLRGIRVRRAASADDFQVVARLRAAGFARITGQKPIDETAWVSDCDYAPGVFSLIGFNEHDVPLATLRIHDGRQRELELAKFVALGKLLKPDDLPAAQFGRLSVVKAECATDAMFALFKAAWRWCYREHLRSIVIATPPWSKPIYDFMFFEHLGADGEFKHAVAGGAEHATMKLPVLDAESIYRHRQHPLCNVFFDTHHADFTI